MPRIVLPTEAWAALLALPSTPEALSKAWTLTPADRALIRTRRGGLTSALGLAAQICALRACGRLIHPNEPLPAVVVEALGSQIGFTQRQIARHADRPAVTMLHHDAALKASGWRRKSRPVEAVLAEALFERAKTVTDPRAMASALLEILRKEKILAPPAPTLNRLVGEALGRAERWIEAEIDGRLTRDQRRRLDALHDVDPNNGVSPMVLARKPPGRPGATELSRLVACRDQLLEIGVTAALLEGLPQERLAILEAESVRLSSQGMANTASTRRHALMAVFSARTAARLLDAIIVMTSKVVARAIKRGEAEVEQDRLRRLDEGESDRAALDALIATLRQGHAGAATLEDVLKAAPTTLLDRLSARSVAAKAAPGRDWRAIANHGATVMRRVGPLFLAACRFEGRVSQTPLLKAAASLRAWYGEPRRDDGAGLPTGFMMQRWRAAARAADGPSMPVYELALLDQLCQRLRAGDIWCADSVDFRCVETQLLPPDIAATRQAEGPEHLRDPHAWIAARKGDLATQLPRVEQALTDGALADVSLERDRLIVRMPAGGDENGEALDASVALRLPSAALTDVLADVAGWTGFHQAFTRLGSGHPHKRPQAVLTAVLAGAIGMNFHQMARACAEVTVSELERIDAWWLRRDTFRSALGALAAAQQTHPLACLMGDDERTSSDGQHFLVGGRGRVHGAVNPHKDAAPALSLYTWVSARHASLGVEAVSAQASEALHVLDGLVDAVGGVDIHTHHTDGGAVSDLVFGLCHLLGISFEPRIPQIGKRKMHGFKGLGPQSTLRPFFAAPVDETRIVEHWDALQRLALSLRAGSIQASHLMRQLAAFPKDGGVAMALREVGRVVRTGFTLRYLEDPALRQRITAELNKGESRNALATAVRFNDGGRFTERGADQRQQRAEALTLVTAAIIFWNTVQMQKILDRMRAEGTVVRKADLASLSPVRWGHINFAGTFAWPKSLRAGEAVWSPELV